MNCACMADRKTIGVMEKMERELQSFQKAHSQDFLCKRHFLKARMWTPSFCSSGQEASQDLKKVIKEPGAKEEEKKVSKGKREEDATASTAKRVMTQRSQSSTMKELKDAELSSENEKLLENDVEEEYDPSQDSSNDDDLFQGPFAIKDADDVNDMSQDMDRYSKLPEKMRKALTGFEPELLQSIPTDISENLGCIEEHFGLHWIVPQHWCS